MQTLEKLFFLGYDLSEGSDLYISYGFCLTARENLLCIDYCTESVSNPFITLNIPLTKKQAAEIGDGVESPSFIRSNFNEQRVNEILSKGYEFARELGIDLEKQCRKQKQAEAIFTAFPNCDVYECEPNFIPSLPYLYLNGQDEYAFVNAVGKTLILGEDNPDFLTF